MKRPREQLVCPTKQVNRNNVKDKTHKLRSPQLSRRILLCVSLVGMIKCLHDIQTSVGLVSGSLLLKDTMELGTTVRHLEEHPYNMVAAAPKPKPTYRHVHDVEIMHVVRTRFMQRQPQLTALGTARLDLFQTFCLPTMVQQTLQDFVWLIYTDPNLDQDLLQKMKQTLQPYPNFYLILSNNNEQTVSQLVDEASKNPLMVATGNLDCLTSSVRAHANSQASMVLYLETGLDADDGLQRNTLLELRKHSLAESYLWNPPSMRHNAYHWLILCVGNHYEWKNAHIMTASTPPLDFRGMIVEHHNRRRCVTPGLTLVQSLTSSEDDASSMEQSTIFDRSPFSYNELVVNHWRLNEKYPNCRKHGANEFEPCWKQINNNDKTHTAIRARTITSTGMKDVVVGEEDQRLSDRLWLTFQNEFGLSMVRVAKTSQQLYQNRFAIVKELVQGRCRLGHSCLDQTEKDMKLFLKGISVSLSGERPNSKKSTEKRAPVEPTQKKVQITSSATKEENRFSNVRDKKTSNTPKQQSASFTDMKKMPIRSVHSEVKRRNTAYERVGRNGASGDPTKMVLKKNLVPIAVDDDDYHAPPLKKHQFRRAW